MGLKRAIKGGFLTLALGCSVLGGCASTPTQAENQKILAMIQEASRLMIHSTADGLSQMSAEELSDCYGADVLNSVVANYTKKQKKADEKPLSGPPHAKEVVNKSLELTTVRKIWIEAYRRKLNPDIAGLTDTELSKIMIHKSPLFTMFGSKADTTSSKLRAEKLVAQWKVCKGAMLVALDEGKARRNK